jgi:prevent-host-death family protein
VKTVNLSEFRKRASDLLTQVENGQSITVLRHGKPIAEVRPVTPEGDHEPAWRKPGLRLAGKGASLADAILADRSE